MASAIGYLSDQGWWTAATIAAGTTSLVLIGLYYNRWLSPGAAVSAAAVAYAIVQLA